MKAARSKCFTVCLALLALVFSWSALAWRSPRRVVAQTGVSAIDHQEKKQKRQIAFRSLIPKEIEIVAIRNYESEKWYEDLEFEIKNNSQKDIWYILLHIGLPEFSIDDMETTFLLEFGSNKPKVEEIPTDQRPAIRSGESHIFKIPPHQVENFKKMHSPDGVTMPEVGLLRFKLYKIYYTDGTGFLNGEPIIRKEGKIMRPGGVSSIPRRSKRSGAGTLAAGNVFSRPSFFLTRTAVESVVKPGAVYYCQPGNEGSSDCGNYRIADNGSWCDYTDGDYPSCNCDPLPNNPGMIRCYF